MTAEEVRALLRRAGARPMWTTEGAFAYPPRCLWTPLGAGLIAREWSRFRGGRASEDPLGLYIHIPAEALVLGRGKPYLESIEREAESLKLPRDLPFRTLYVGSSGAGALSALPAAAIGRLLGWARLRFRLDALEQAAVELDAAEVDAAKARALARNGVDRVASCLPPDDGTEGASRRRRAFLEGVRLCRKAGIPAIAVDVPAGEAGCFAVRESGPNLQLAHAARLGASVLGLGWGAVSRIRERLVYGKSGACSGYAAAMLAGGGARYAGSRLGPRDEMRGYMIRSFEDTGSFKEADFRKAFGVEPMKAWPKELGALLAEGLLVRRDGRLEVSRPQDPAVASTALYGPRVLAGLSRRLALGAKPESLGATGDDAFRAEGWRARARAPGLDAEGLRLLARGRAEAALRLFEQALEGDPSDFRALLHKASALAALGDLEAALDACDEAVGLRPQGPGALPDALAARASLHARLGQRGLAARDLEEALGAAPADWEGLGAARKALSRLRR